MARKEAVRRKKKRHARVARDKHRRQVYLEASAVLNEVNGTAVEWYGSAAVQQYIGTAVEYSSIIVQQYSSCQSKCFCIPVMPVMRFFLKWHMIATDLYLKNAARPP